MRSISGDFAMYRTKTPDGKDAIMIVIEPDGAPPLLHSYNDGDSQEISFERVEGGDSAPDQYVTITHTNGDKTHFGPYYSRVVKQ